MEKLKWHPAFYGAIELDFDKDHDKLIFENELTLGKEPIRVDLNIIKKKDVDSDLENEIGKIFRKYNIVEYKSPEDGLNIDDFYKVVAYAALYKSLGNHVDERRVEDVTITLIRERYPRELFRKLRNQGYEIKEKYPGIYYVTGKLIFQAQVVVGKRLRGHSSLKVLTDELEEEVALDFLRQSDEFNTQLQKRNVDAVYAVSVIANHDVYDKIRRRENRMFEVLKEFFKEEIEAEKAIVIAEGLAEGREKGMAEGREKGMAEGREKGMAEGSQKIVIKTAIRDYKNGKYTNEEIIANIVDDLEVDEEKAKSIFEKEVLAALCIQQ